MLGSRLMSMVFPDPGEPISRMLCLPEAAISMARLAASWPLMS